jgi:hypothetical protein
MSTNEDPVISAQVLLRAADGKKPSDADLTAARIKQIVPDRPTIDMVTGVFSRARFEVGQVVGLSFSITGRRSLFDSFLGVSGAGTRPGEVSLERLPQPARRAIAAITFPPPPDFGPRSYSSD